jgi:hypothetical protein
VSGAQLEPTGTPPLPGVTLPVPKPPARISPLRWALWWFEIALALFIFYGVFSVGWVLLRVAAGIADRRSRRRKR